MNSRLCVGSCGHFCRPGPGLTRDEIGHGRIRSDQGSFLGTRPDLLLILLLFPSPPLRPGAFAPRHDVAERCHAVLCRSIRRARSWLHAPHPQEEPLVACVRGGGRRIRVRERVKESELSENRGHEGTFSRLSYLSLCPPCPAFVAGILYAVTGLSRASQLAYQGIRGLWLV